MVPRILSARRIFFWLTAAGCCVLVLLLYQHRDTLNEYLPPPGPVSHAPWPGDDEQQPPLPMQVLRVPTHQGQPAPAPPAQKVVTRASHPRSDSVDGSSGDRRLPWFFTGGTEFPEKRPGEHLRLYPDQESGDRITSQLMHVPENYEGYDSPEKVVLAFNGLGQWYKRAGSGAFHGCPVNRCTLTDDKSRAIDADAIIFKDHMTPPGVTRPAHQVWMLYFLECPYHTQNVKQPDAFNWTATYRTDSTLVAPYEKWTYYSNRARHRIQHVNFAANKTRKVAWFVSNCGSRNGRLSYARELAKHIQVDIYGTCGTLHCPRSDKKCFEILERDYKFYLAFENSNCRDYITEKLFVNGLQHNVLPIVMGARPEDYEHVAPEGSYIHVDEFSGPEELAAYLKRLDADDEMYNSYFRWKGTGEFINTYFWCRLCTMLHASPTEQALLTGAANPRFYPDVNEWWRGPGVCTVKSWRTSDGR